MDYIEAISSYEPANEQEKAEKRVILNYIMQFKDNILTRENEFAHMTSSGFILNKDLTKTLMIYHNIYDTWAWTGGHADGDKDLLYVAIKEAKEETGIVKVTPLIEDIASVDILPVWGHVKKGKYVATHMHLNVSYLLIADEEEAVHIKADENSGVKWLALEDLERYCNEPEIVEIYKKLIIRAKAIKNRG